MSKEHDFRIVVRLHLELLSDQIIPVLKQLIFYTYPEEVFALCFEIFPDSFTSKFPIRAFFMNKDNIEHFEYIEGEAEYPSPVDPALLDIHEVYPIQLEEKFENLEEDISLGTISSDETAHWFYDCWVKAGGNNFYLEATIANHDSGEELNLKTGEWQENSTLFVF
jgi:hypothetical protein